MKIRGGQKLKEALSILATLANNPATLRVGFLERATYPDGKSVAMVAAIQDFGAPGAGIPPRPFFRNMVAENKGEWPRQLGNLLVQEDFDAEKALGLMGQGIKGQLQQAIADFVGVPLKPATVKRKGNDKQLVDTGNLLNNVDYDVQT